MILYIENPKDTTKKLLELTNEFSKVAGTKLIYRNLWHSYTLMMKNQKEKLSKHSHHCNKMNKIPRNKPTEGDKRSVCRKL